MKTRTTIITVVHAEDDADEMNYLIREAFDAENMPCVVWSVEDRDPTEEESKSWAESYE